MSLTCIVREKYFCDCLIHFLLIYLLYFLILDLKNLKLLQFVYITELIDF